jgi:hypothetical protein
MSDVAARVKAIIVKQLSIDEAKERGIVRDELISWVTG